MATNAAVLAKYQGMLKPSGGQELSDSLIIILGAPGAGKTTLAVTASEFMPDALPAPKFTMLEDVVVIGCDEGATDGLASLGLGVKLIDFNAIDRDLKNPTQSMQVAIDLAVGSGAKICVWDTVSKFDLLLNAWLTEHKELWTGQGGGEDKFAMFRYILATYQVLMTSFRKFSGLRIANFHAKALYDDLTKDATQKERTERQDKAQGVGGMASLVLDVSGRARDLWTRDASLVLGVRQLQIPGKAGLQREVLTTFDAGADMLTKNRFESRLPAKIPANLRAAIRLVRGT
jgi:hypothetical protein